MQRSAHSPDNGYNSQQVERLIFKRGMFFGLILVGLDLMVTILARLTSFPVHLMTSLMNVIYFPWSMVSFITNATIYLPVLCIAGFIYFYAGYMIARHSGGNIRASALTGLLAGLVLGICDLVVSAVILFAETLPSITQSYGSASPTLLDAVKFTTIRDTFLYTFGFLVLALLLGAGLAAMGGLRGRPNS
ncbi:hypothetical protein KSC_058740 [Ktedonobacter sp. SOSP1-52]|uniref:hypothetical protein n=1 Tax=Ktedonobacter sp. SOSP1-52 TaxID=2778366 RepID=UPI001916274B|nr:hypothetical protein [Ktedonobacter sp. SOSP1-52]GHO66982.1 hypothetical protein KSC_058740 [Ktedonobacter sp. SOSP1-52]